MHSRTPRRAAALAFVPLLAGTAGAVAAPALKRPAPSVAEPALAAASSTLGDLRATAERREAERLQRARAARRRAARALRFPVAGRVDLGEQAGAFGNDRGSHTHQGQDVFAAAGTPVRAVTSSIVVEAGSGDARGNHVALYDRRRDRTYVYFHLQAPASVSVGERVPGGRRIGRVGCTGRCSGDHLHFEVRAGRGADGRALDPSRLLRRARRA